MKADRGSRLGDTELEVSSLGLGLAALGRPGYINLCHGEDLGHDYGVAVMEARAHAVLDRAYDAGLRYVDAARSYGRAEEFLSSWLEARAIAPGDITVGSKWGYRYTAGWSVEAPVHEVKEHDDAMLSHQLAESRAHLGPHLDLYQIHSATLDSGVLEHDAVLDDLARLREEGMVIGLSTSGVAQGDTIRRALTVERDGRMLFQSVQATWNLLEPSAGDALREAHAAGLGVIVKEALANGRLTARNGDPAFARSRALLEREAGGLGASLDALALAAAITRPWSDVVLSGASTAEQLESNLEALEISADALHLDALAALAEPAAVYWGTRKDLPWN